MDSFLHSEFHRIRLPTRKVLGLVTLKDGRINSLGPIHWSVTETQRSSGGVRVKTTADLSSLNATYTCSVRIGSCSHTALHISHLTSHMDISMHPSGLVRLLHLTLNTGDYTLNGTLGGRPITHRGPIPDSLKDNLAKYILSLANRTKIQTDPEKCNVLISAVS